MKTTIRIWSYLAHFFLEWKMFETRVVEKFGTHILCSTTLFGKLCCFYIMWENIVNRDRPHITIWRMRIACWIPYLLTYSMMQSPFWEANWFAASQEIPRISRNPKVHYRTHKRPPPVSILGQPNPVHIPTSYLLEMHPNIINPSTPRSLQWSPSLRFPQQDPIHLTHMRHMPSSSHSSRFYHPHNVGWGVQII